jgi:MFS family permease
MVLTGLVSAVAFLGLVLFPTRGFLILFNIVSGLAQSTRQVTVSPFLMHNTSREERQYVFSFNFGLNTIAGFVGNLVGGLLPLWLGRWVGVPATSTLAYRLALGSMVLISLLATGPLMALRSRRQAVEREVEMPWTLLKRFAKPLTRLVLPQWIIGLGAGMMMPFMNLYFRKVFERSDSTVGIVLGSTALAMAVAQFIAPPIADRIGKINIVVLTEALSVPFLLTLGLAAFAMPRGANLVMWFVIAWGAYLLRTALMNMSGPVYQTFVLEQVPENVQALAMSLNGIAFQFGWVLSPQLSGYFQATVGFVPVFLTTATLYIVAIVVTWAFFGSRRNQATDESAPERERPQTALIK